MSELYYQDDLVTLYHGDCLDVLRSLPDASVDAVCTDPPYGLEFMGREWDGSDGFRRSLNSADVGRENAFGRASRTSPEYRAGTLFQEWCEAWSRECLRVLKPGGHMLAFGGTRTFHRLACAVEDAGFEIRDSIAWLHGQGFPKNLNVSKALDGARCTCPPIPYDHAGNVRGVRGDLPEATESPEARSLADLLPTVQRNGARPGVGPVRGAGAEDARPLRAEVRGGQPCMEGRRDPQADEGQLQGRQVCPLPTGVSPNGEVGRLHLGTPSRDGAMGGSDADPFGVREPQGPEPVEQPAGEPGALPDQRRPQAWGGWPVCERCSQPVIPDGLGTAAKPAFEPVVVARKPLVGTVAANVLAHGTGALNVDACRVGVDGGSKDSGVDSRSPESVSTFGHGLNGRTSELVPGLGRWPANVVLDESQAGELDEQSGQQRDGVAVQRNRGPEKPNEVYGGGWGNLPDDETYGGQGGASRFFYVAKAASDERVRVAGTSHPTVKPLALMRWLVRLVTPPGGTVLEPFAGSGTTVEACLLEGFQCIAIEREADYLPLIVQRINRRRDPVKAILASGEEDTLFGSAS
jgi:DNA modification methylase